MSRSEGDWNENDEMLYNLEVQDTLERMDEEMKDDQPQPIAPIASPSQARARQDGERSDSSTWNFVQMNMSLLPIARPLPVSICNRFHEGVVGRKPRTPNQKLHHRVLHNASNISPRRHDVDPLPRRAPSAPSHENNTAVDGSEPLPQRTGYQSRCMSAPIEIPGRRGKRKSIQEEDCHMSSSWQAGDKLFQDDETSRSRSLSEDLMMDDIQSWSESPGGHSGGFVLSRSASVSSGFAQRSALFKGKRILELQDEERRLVPDERASLPSPSKRSRHV